MPVYKQKIESSNSSERLLPALQNEAVSREKVFRICSNEVFHFTFQHPTEPFFH